MLLTKPHQKDKMAQEISIHRSLNHQHIVGFQSFFEDSNFVYIVLELCKRRVCFQVLAPPTKTELNLVIHIVEFDGASQEEEGDNRTRGSLFHVPLASRSKALARAKDYPSRFEAGEPLLERQHGAQDWRFRLGDQARL